MRELCYSVSRGVNRTNKQSALTTFHVFHPPARSPQEPDAPEPEAGGQFNLVAG